MAGQEILNSLEKKYVRLISDNLRDGEQVHAAEAGMTRAPVLDKKDSLTDGVLVVTDQRVLLVSKFWLQESVRTIPVSKISSVQTQKGMLGLVSIEVITSNEELEIKVNKNAAPNLIEAIEAQRNALEGENKTPQELSNPLDQIEKLADLHAKGILSDDEFSQKKSKLLEEI